MFFVEGKTTDGREEYSYQVRAKGFSITQQINGEDLIYANPIASL